MDNMCCRPVKSNGVYEIEESIREGIVIYELIADSSLSCGNEGMYKVYGSLLEKEFNCLDATYMCCDCYKEAAAADKSILTRSRKVW